MNMTAYFDELCDIASTSLHHTKYSASKDEELILKELANLESLTTSLGDVTAHSRTLKHTFQAALTPSSWWL